jgi:hypothetical protein
MFVLFDRGTSYLNSNPSRLARNGRSDHHGESLMGQRGGGCDLETVMVRLWGDARDGAGHHAPPP